MEHPLFKKHVLANAVIPRSTLLTLPRTELIPLCLNLERWSVKLVAQILQSTSSTIMLKTDNALQAVHHQEQIQISRPQCRQDLLSQHFKLLYPMMARDSVS
jgi:hypothetical protein